ncbi:sigma-70 family RNA polymerase sigma factor [Glycomyces sp. NPDC021274]|uniref:sigma-70 family RNA polymerase sigma factor n=1 Tax=Glycomyces sp. NPDC021274 TaxID=3155120 RepID=UPI0033D9E63C
MRAQHTALSDRDESAREPEASEDGAWERANFFLSADEVSPDEHPSLTNFSAAWMYDAMIRPLDPEQLEFVAIDMDPGSLEMRDQIGVWNAAWEAGQFRRRLFAEEELPQQMAKVADLGDLNVMFVPRSESRYFEYAPLYHLLPKAVLDKFKLPLLKRASWPHMGELGRADRLLPGDFAQRLAKAWAWVVWPHLDSGSRPSAYKKTDSIRLLAHNLDFWVPPVTTAVQEMLQCYPEVDKGRSTGPVRLENGEFLEGAVVGNPRAGGLVWMGEAEAAEMVALMVDTADRTGRLRDVLAAVRAHRVEEDFSSDWSYAREDFERQLYRKRNKVQVRFIELTDTIPVQGPESEIVGKLVTSDFLALLDAKQRQIIILLSSGYRQHEVAEVLGYANHSPIAKRLAQIRQQAAAFFDLDW